MEEQANELRSFMSESFPSPRHKTKVISITSGKGGVGKTNMAVNLAIAYSQIGKKVILIDGDLGMANVNVLLGLVPKYNLMHVINHKKKLSEIILDTEFGFRFIAGANGFSKIANLSNDELDYFANQFSSLSDADIIIIDTGAGISNNVLQFLAVSDEIFIIATPEPTSITDAYGIIKIITTELTETPVNLKLLVNRVHSADEGRRISDLIINVCGQFLGFKVDYIGYVYDDPVVQASVIRQKPFMIINPTSKPAVCLKHIVGRIGKTDVPNDGGVSNFLQKFLRGRRK